MTSIETFKHRQSVRSYRDEAIPEDVLKELVQAANAAPVAMGAYDDYHLSLVTNADLMNQACQSLGPDANPLHGAPAWFIVSVSEEKNTTYSSAAIISHQIALAAYDLDLAACHIWGLLSKVKEDAGLMKELGIPDGYTPTASVIVGYPSEDLNERDPVTDRIAYSEVK